MIQVSYDQARSNIETWLDALLGITPEWAKNPNIDQYITNFGIVFIAISIIIFIIIYKKSQDKTEVFKDQSLPKIEILFEQGKEPYLGYAPLKKVRHEIMYGVDGRHGQYTGRFKIQNLDEAQGIDKVQVRLIDVTPSQEWIKSLPLPLRLKDDKLRLQEFDINPGDDIYMEVFDYFCQGQTSWPKLVLLHPLGDRQIEAEEGIHYNEKEPIVFKVKISSQNSGKPIIKKFRFDPSQDDANMWVDMGDPKKLEPKNKELLRSIVSLVLKYDLRIKDSSYKPASVEYLKSKVQDMEDEFEIMLTKPEVAETCRLKQSILCLRNRYSNILGVMNTVSFNDEEKRKAMKFGTPDIMSFEEYKDYLANIKDEYEQDRNDLFALCDYNYEE